MHPDRLLDHLLSLPQVWDARLAPDARHVAWTWYRRLPTAQVFAAATTGERAPVALTEAEGETTLVSWTFDAQGVVVEEDRYSDERTQLFLVRLSHPGEMMPLTEHHPPYFPRGGQLSPEGRYLFYGANYDFEQGRVIEPTWIYRLDLRTGERLAIARPLRPAWTAPLLNPQGTWVLYTRKDRHPSGRQVHLVRPDGSEDREVLNFGDRAKVWARWMPDGEHVLFTAENLEHEPPYRRAGLYHVSTGRITWIVDDPDWDVESAWPTPQGEVVLMQVREARAQAWLWRPDAPRLEPLVVDRGTFLPLGHPAHDPDLWVGLYYRSTHPRDVVLARKGEEGLLHVVASLTRVWDVTPLSPEDLTPAEDFRWHSVDGLEIQGWLYRARPNRKRAIIYIHGGPTSHIEDELITPIQYFVARGFNVLAVNYRGSTGFGLAFQEAIKEDGWGGREQADIATGAEALIRAGLAEPGRVGVTGTSYGGYSSWFLITHYPPEVIAAAAPICGMTDLVVDYETTRPDLRPYSEEMMGGSPQEVPEKYYERSPINFVQNIRGKLLIVQGMQDPNVTPENVRVVRERLEALGIPYELLVFEDEGHGIVKPKNQRVLYKALADFFERALG